ncbi:unnamed protein product [Linum trigynum]|uniref:Serine aminopeptidase S33 domain-containing protein n=1 Tax=Linum trigynum TaxID=586398 RepID=A0AAV2EX78_9ROSI
MLVTVQTKVVISNQQGEKLVGILHDTGSKELVIICHGFQSSKERIPMVNLAAAIERGGTCAFRFDFAGNGESEGSFQYGNYYSEVDDLRSVVLHFRETHVIKVLIGHSKGGNVVLLYASKYNDVDTIVNISGRFYLERGIEGRLGKDYLRRIKETGYIDVRNRKGEVAFRVTEKSLMDRLNTDTHRACLLVPQECRVLTVHGSKDQLVPVEDAVQFSKLIRNHRLCIVDGADHEYTSHQENLVSLILDFLREAQRDCHSLRSRF